MSTNNTFSFSRLGLVMKRDLMENWKANLYRFLGPYAVFLFAMLIGYVGAEDMDDFIGYSSIIFSTFTYLLLIGSAYSASQIMETMNTQQKRLSYLMLPATSLEKFVVRALYVTVGFVVMATLALLLAEASRFLFMPFFDLPESFHQSILSGVFDTSLIDSWSQTYVCRNVLGALCTILVMCWGHSLFILGGCYWQKHPFWKTLGIILLVNQLIIMFIFFLAETFGDIDLSIDGEWLEAHMAWVTIEGVLGFLSVLFALLLALNWWLSYCCFTRSQVIKPKFRLL
ncbi:MAG: hypothetical protein IKW32_09800 [Bacteroidaceae bacterium]|nr:hypothetical protein [Bacteroidaceae bacterium]